MTAATTPLDDALARGLDETPSFSGRSRRRELVEFLVTGGGTLVIFPLAVLARRLFGLDEAELAAGFLTFYGAYVVNDPHFAVTYLLFYRNVKSRWRSARWIGSGIVVPIVLTMWAAAALCMHSAHIIGWMVQLMYLLVGWHYVKQGFGVLTVLSARRHVRLGAPERRAFLFHCYAGWAYAWASPAIPSGEFEEKGVVYTALAHPRWLELATGGVFALSTIGLLVVVLVERRRLGRFVPFAPAAGLLVTVWLWTIYSSIDPVMRYLIPALHSLQYFYFVVLLRRNEARAFEGPPSFGKPAGVRVGFLLVTALLLGWLLFRGAPTFLDDTFIAKPRRGAFPDELGVTPFFALFFVGVSIHHYFMDSVIWRRDNPDTRWLTP